jgi:hypothetical protein
MSKVSHEYAEPTTLCTCKTDNFLSWIVKRYGKYGRNRSRIVKRFGKYGRKASWIVKWYGKYGRILWNDMENIEESQVE